MMTEARQKELLSAQSTTAQKVFEVVPIQDWWSPHKIIQQLGNSVGRHEVVLGTLDTLKRSGLIREKDGAFQREKVREKKGLKDLRDIVLPPEQPAPPMPHTAPAKPEPTKAPMTTNTDPVDDLGRISQRMNALALNQQVEREAMAQRHREELEALAHEVADAAIEVQGALEAGNDEVNAARDLKKLLDRIR